MKNLKKLTLFSVFSLLLSGCSFNLKDLFSKEETSNNNTSQECNCEQQEKEQEEKHEEEQKEEITAKSIKNIIGLPSSIKQDSVLTPSNLAVTVVYSDNSEKIELATNVVLDTSIAGKNILGKVFYNTLFKDFYIEVTPKETVNPQPKNKYYLPEEIVEYNGYTDQIEKQVKYEYDDDLLGYTKTEIITAGGSPRKEVYYYRFFTDFSACITARESYDSIEEDAIPSFIDQHYYTFSENGSYQDVYYIMGNDSSDHSYIYSLTNKTFNEKGQLIEETEKRPYEEGGSEYYYSYFVTNTYDDEGYPLKFEEWDYDDRNNPDTFKVHYYEEYVYDNNERSHCTRHEYELNDGEYKEISYTDINIANENGIRKYDEQIYTMDDEPFNHNIFWENENFERIYAYYGGMDEEYGITLNESGQITNYFKNDELGNLKLNVIYDNIDGKIISSNHLFNGKISNELSSTTYLYNKNNQITEARHYNYYEQIFENEIFGKVSWENVTTITYSDLQEDFLLDYVDYMNEIIPSYGCGILEDNKVFYFD